MTRKHGGTLTCNTKITIVSTRIEYTSKYFLRCACAATAGHARRTAPCTCIVEVTSFSASCTELSSK